MSEKMETEPKFVYPQARRDEIVEDYHGTQVADPYRWLEDPDASDTQAWVSAQNGISAPFLSEAPARPQIKAKLTELWDFSRYGLPFRKKDRYFFSKNDGLQNQDVIYLQHSLDGEAFELLNPNKFSDDGTVALSNLALSDDGTLLAYGTSGSGSDWQELRVRTVNPDGGGQLWPEVIKWCKFSGIAWKPDNTGFYYSRFPDPGTVAVEDQSNYNQVYWHQVGTPQERDVLIFERPDFKELGFVAFITDDDQYLCLHVWNGTDSKSRFYYRELDSNGPFVRLLDKADAKYDFVGNVGSNFYFQTDLDAPRNRVVAVDVAQTSPAADIKWQEIIAQQPDVLAFVSVVNHQLVVAYMHDVHHEVKTYQMDGSFVRDITLPTLGSIVGVSGEPEDSEMFLGLESFLYPMSVLRYDFQTDQLKVFRQPKVDFQPANYETKQVFYPSKDGTAIPMFLVYKKGLELSGQNPTILYGYGGFNISLTPGFRVWRTVWLENGGIYAVANLRGGDEYGEEWHQAGMLAHKQNVFDDFAAAGDWLIANRYTSNKRLAIMGGSNGGLLVAACMLQRPDLYGAVICQVPVIDMLRYQKFTVGRYWVPEYGDAEANPEQFKFIYAYSPLHNVKVGATYPPLLIATADTDDRVVPAHAKKFGATLQAAANYHSQNPLLLRVETKAGHGAGKPTAKLIDELSDELGFLFRVFNMQIK